MDAPEGGFDAIMQAIVCEDMIGWREKARRLLVFSTDAGFHYAGDGKLGGIVKPNDGLCHLDAKGVYTHSSELDYPSVSQINHKVKENSVNLIFAVTEEQFGVYDLLQQNIEGSSVGTLSADSSNIVQLVKAQYEAITSSIEMKDNSTEYVKVTYHSNCVGDGPMRQTNRCSGLRLGQRVKFTAKIEVVKCPKDPREWHQVFQIYPVGINEAVLVDLTMMCQCECEKPGNPVSIGAQKPKAFSTAYLLQYLKMTQKVSLYNIANFVSFQSKTVKSVTQPLVPPILQFRPFCAQDF